MKKLIAVLLTTVVVAGLIGCGVSMEKDVAQTETTMEEGQSGENYKLSVSGSVFYVINCFSSWGTEYRSK